jgi:hypothetical protein
MQQPRDPDIRHIRARKGSGVTAVLECTRFSPFARALQHEIQRPLEKQRRLRSSVPVSALPVDAR